jgi:hypothetical protein
MCAATFLFACSDRKKTPETKVASASKTEAEKPADVIDEATMQKNWEAYATPGAPHQEMAKWNGNWEGDVTMWMDPAAPPTKSKATATNKMIMGGRYQLSTHKGNMFNMPFEGMSIVGYDNFKKTFVSTWIDNFGTGVMTLEGPWNESTKSMELKGKMIDPGTKKECEVREVFRIIDDNTQVMEMYGTKDGKETKSMEIRFTRKS